MKSCSCQDCVSACNNDPGRLVPEDLLRISTLLKITQDQLVKRYLVKIPFEYKGIKGFSLAPAKIKGKNFVAEPGETAPDYYASERGRCIFLEDERCSKHSAKPFECSAYMGCENTFLGKPYRERAVEDFFISRWKSFKHSA